MLRLFVLVVLLFSVGCDSALGMWGNNGVFSIARLSTSSSGVQANAGSSTPSMSADGRFVVFTSRSDNLVAGDSNGRSDVFLKDMQTGTVSRISVGRDAAGNQVEANSDSGNPSISADGRYVAFGTNADNLVANDRNVVVDAFVKDRLTGEVSLMSVTPSGTQINHDVDPGSLVISADGRFVAFSTDADSLVPGGGGVAFDKRDVFVKNRVTGVVSLVSQTQTGTIGNQSSTKPSISADGRYVAFTSAADNLVAGDSNGRKDVFLKDQSSGRLTRVSLGQDAAGNQVEGNGDSSGPSISADGQVVAFRSAASNLVSGDMNGKVDVFVRDQNTGTVSRVSTDSSGREGNEDSAFTFTEESPSISADGRVIAFESSASNLVSGDTNRWPDVFVKDRSSGEIARVSTSVAGGEANRRSDNPFVSGDGRFVAFQSAASNLVLDDTNGDEDVFGVAWREHSVSRQDSVVPTSSAAGIANGVSGPVSPVASGISKLSGVRGVKVRVVGKEVRIAGGLVCVDGSTCAGRVSLDFVVPHKKRVVHLASAVQVAGNRFEVVSKDAGAKLLRGVFRKNASHVRVMLHVTTLDQAVGAKPVVKDVRVTAQKVKR